MILKIFDLAAFERNAFPEHLDPTDFVHVGRNRCAAQRFGLAFRTAGVIVAERFLRALYAAVV